MTALNSYQGTYELEFERPLLQLERQIAELESNTGLSGGGVGSGSSQAVDLGVEIRKLRESHTAMLRKIYEKLGAWQTVQVARHPGRPQPVNYIRAFVKD